MASQNDRAQPPSRLQHAGATSHQQRVHSEMAAQGSLWTQLLNKIPQVRNTTQYYAHDAIRATTDAVGGIATTIQQTVAEREHEELMALRARARAGAAAKVPETPEGYGLSRFAFRNTDDQGAPISQRARIPRKNSDEFDCFDTTSATSPSATQAQRSKAFGDSSSTVSLHSPIGEGMGPQASDKAVKFGTYNTRATAKAAANAASRVATAAAANITTGIYNMLNAAGVVPEVHYDPGEAIYGSAPASVAAYLGGNISADAAAASAGFVPSYGHPMNAYTTVTQPTPQRDAPLSFVVRSASMQTIPTRPHEGVAAGHGSDNGTHRKGHRQTTNVFGTSSPTADVSLANYLALTLEDGFAIFECDSTGVYEVIAHVRGDAVFDGFMLKHAIGPLDMPPTPGAPPQPKPTQLVDVKVLADPRLSDATPSEPTVGYHTPPSPTEGASGTAIVTFTSASPLITFAAMTDTFLHYRATNAGDTVCEKHQRVKVVECLPRCVFECDGEVNTIPHQQQPTEAIRPHEFFVPLPPQAHQQTVLAAQSVGTTLGDHLGPVRTATAGLLYRVVSQKTFVNSPTLGQIDVFPPNPLQHGDGASSGFAGALCVISGALTDAELASMEGVGGNGRRKESASGAVIPKKAVAILGYTNVSAGAEGRSPTDMVQLHSIITDNGVHSVGDNWLAYAGSAGFDAAASSPDGSSRPLYAAEPQTTLRAEVSQNSKEYYAKAASSGWSRIGAYLGMGEKPADQNASTADDVVLNSDGRFTGKASSAATGNTSEGTVILCDVSRLMGLAGVGGAASLASGYHHNFCSFAAHNHPLQCLAFDASGTMLATASTSGTSVNVYQIVRKREPLLVHRGEGSDLSAPTRLVTRGGMAGADGATNKAPTGGHGSIDGWGIHDVHLLNGAPLGSYVGEVTLLYRLLRGSTSAVISSIAFAPLSASIAVATSIGTCHFYHLDDHHYVSQENQEQLDYYHSQAATAAGEARPDPNVRLRGDKPFVCYKVGVRGELAALRKAPMVDPICRARSAATTPAPWPIVAYMHLPLYRPRATVAVVDEQRDRTNPNKAVSEAAANDANEPSGQRPHKSLIVSTFDAFVVCPASLSVTSIQYSAAGGIVRLYTAPLASFQGPRWHGIRGAPTPARHANEGHSSIPSEDMAWLLQHERHCARSSDYSWAHCGKRSTFAIRPPQAFPADPTCAPICGPAQYRADNSSYATHYASLLFEVDDTSLDACAEQAVEDEEWDTALGIDGGGNDSVDDVAYDDDFIVA